MDSIQVYLADFKNSDRSQDYVLKDWKKINLAGFGSIDSLSFHLSSSDTDSIGMKTPAYFCIDNIGIEFVESINNNDRNTLDVTLYPNPVKDVLNLEASIPVVFTVFDLTGKVLMSGEKKKSINVKDLAPGIYLIKVGDEKAKRSSSFLFQKTP